MKSMLTPSRTLALSLLLLGFAPAAPAQSLGAARSEAWIGQPLLLTVPANLEPGGKEDCVHADVFYGDNRISAGQVRASLMGEGSARRVRIESDQPVDEPVVTVSVRAGCHNTMTRSYTLLPELPSATMLAAANLPQAPMQPAGRLSRNLATQVSGASAGRPMRVADAAPRSMRVADVVARPRPARSIIKVRQARATPSPAGAGPRLRLENWEPDAQTMLRVSSFMAAPAQDGAGRATAALLWQALNAGPEQILRTSASLQQLEGELAQLRQTAGQTHDEMLALRRELEAPAAFGVPARALQMLALLLALVAATAAFLWYRTSRGGAGGWTGAPIDSVLDGLATPPQPMPAAPQAPAERAMVEPLADTPVRTPAAPRAVPVAVPRPAPAMQVRSPSATMMRVETLAATFEEVDFLASLGLWNDAMDILKTYLEDSAAPAPLAYYELMRLCVHTDDAASLVQVRKRYAQVFGVESPKFEQINAPLGLEAYPELSNRISGAWGTPEAQDFIELSLFTVAPAGKAFSLQAGRDLLALHDLAMTLGRDSDLASADEDDGSTLAPWARAEDSESARLAVHASSDAAGANRFGLDLDLSVASEQIDAGESMAAPLELVPPPMSRGGSDPFATGEAPLDEDFDPFSAAVASERMRRI